MLERESALIPARVLVADPPWQFNDKLPGETRGAAKQYDVLDLQAIKDFRLPILADDAWLFMWRVSSMVEDAYDVCRCWGFTPKTELVWLKRTVNGKRHFGMGRYLRAEHESCIVATRGRVQPLVRNVRTTFEAAVGRHSEKPLVFYDIVEQLSQGPYVELFARRHRAGWTCFGNELENT